MKTKKELGLYIHIPFCKKKCNYCDFLSFGSDSKMREAYVQAVRKEMAALSMECQEYVVTTVFFGGGTPSILEAQQMTLLMNSIKQHFLLHQDAEITIEMNPGTVTKDKLLAYKKMGINRLSIGLQSTDEEELKALGRIHNFDEFFNNYQMARELGFSNINIDLMSALPGQTLESYLDGLNRVIELRPEHISSYSLIIEEGTPFYGDSKIYDSLPPEEEDRAMYEKTEEFLKDSGYHRYEISNYSLPGYESRHNCVYWTGGDYLGIGLGASSYFAGARFHNVETIVDYLQNPETSCGQRPDYHLVSEAEAMEEFMFLGLRMSRGIDINEFESQFKVSIRSVYGSVIDKEIQAGTMKIEPPYLFLTKKGIDISNQVLSEFLLDIE